MSDTSTTKLDWLKDEKDVYRYLFAQSFGNVTAQAFLHNVENSIHLESVPITEHLSMDYIIDYCDRCTKKALEHLKTL